MSRKKRILISTLSLNIGGAEVFAMSLASALSKGNDVYLFYHNEVVDDLALQAKYISPEVRTLSMNLYPRLNFICWKLNALFSRIKPGFSFHDFARKKLLRYLVRKHKIELLSNHSVCHDKDCLDVLSGLNIPLVITEHGGHSAKIYQGQKDTLPVLVRADHIVAVSIFNKELLSNALSVSKVPISVIYNGVQTPENTTLDAHAVRKQLGIPDDTYVFGMISRGVAGKGWEVAIQSFLRLKSRISTPAMLVLVGGSEYLDTLRLMYKDEAGVIFAGPSSDPFGHIATFDVGLLPTLFKTESLPLTIIEYLCCQKPVIATNTGGVPELLRLEGNELGQLVDLNESGTIDIDEFAAAMLRYMNDRELYERHKAMTPMVCSMFSMETCAREYDVLFEQIINASTDKLKASSF